MTKNVRLVDHQHNASCTLPNWQWHCDSKIIKRQQRPHLTYNAIHLTVPRIIHAIRFQSCGYSLRTPKESHALNGCWANGWQWHLAEAQAANDSVWYSSRSALRSQFAYPERNTRPGQLLSKWVAVTLIGSASSQWPVFDIARVRLCYGCWLRLSSVLCALGPVCVLSFSPY